MKPADIAAMGPLQRKELLEDVIALVRSGEWRLGEAVRFLRTIVLRKNRPDFARLVGISRGALQQLEERPDANPTLDTLNRALRPFGGELGLVFPRMTPAPEASSDDQARRAKLQATLRASRRRSRRDEPPSR